MQQALRSATRSLLCCKHLSRARADVRVQAIIATAAPIMRRAGVTTDDGKSGRRSEGRTNDLAWLRHDENETISAVVERVANLVGLPVENAEKLQVIHYQEGQRYLPQRSNLLILPLI